MSHSSSNNGSFIVHIVQFAIDSFPSSLLSLNLSLKLPLIWGNEFCTKVKLVEDMFKSLVCISIFQDDSCKRYLWWKANVRYRLWFDRGGPFNFIKKKVLSFIYLLLLALWWTWKIRWYSLKSSQVKRLFSF